MPSLGVGPGGTLPPGPLELWEADMASKRAAEDDLGACDNHPDTPAVHVTDGVKFQAARLCKECLGRWERALTGPRRG